MLKIKHELDRLGITQKQLAQRLDMKPQAICRIVNGREPAYSKRGQRIADAVGWTDDWQQLFEEVDADD